MHSRIIQQVSNPFFTHQQQVEFHQQVEQVLEGYPVEQYIAVPYPYVHPQLELFPLAERGKLFAEPGEEEVGAPRPPVRCDGKFGGNDDYEAGIIGQLWEEQRERQVEEMEEAAMQERAYREACVELAIRYGVPLPVIEVHVPNKKHECAGGVQ